MQMNWLEARAVKLRNMGHSEDSGFSEHSASLKPGSLIDPGSNVTRLLVNDPHNEL